MPQSSNPSPAIPTIQPTYNETTPAPAPNNPTILKDLQNLLKASKDTDVYIYPKIIGRSSTPSDNNLKFLNTFDLALEWEFLEPAAKNQKRGKKKNVGAIFTSLDIEGGWKYWAVFIVHTPELSERIPEGTTLLLMDHLLPPKTHVLFQDLNSRQQSFTWSLKNSCSSNSSTAFGLVNMKAGPWKPHVRFSDFGEESYTYSELVVLWLKERLVEAGFAARGRDGCCWGWDYFFGGFGVSWGSFWGGGGGE